MIRRVVSAAIAVGFFATATVVMAEPNKPASKPNKVKVTHKPSSLLKRAPQKITFGNGDLIRGTRATGAGSLVEGERRKQFSHLILVRSTFIPELIKSADKVW